MSDDGLRDRLAAESKVLRDAAWSGPAATMMDAHSKLSSLNNLLVEALPHLDADSDLAERIRSAVMNPKPDPETTVGPRP